MKKTAAGIIAFVLLFLLLCGSAVTESGMTEEDAAACELMNRLFAACAGTDEETELAARREMKEEELLQRNAENAEYRALVFPWLTEALFPESETAARDEALTEEELKEFQNRLEAAYEGLNANVLGRKYLEYAFSLGAADMSSVMEVTKRYAAVWMEQINPEKLTAMNGDYEFWLYSAGTPMDYPVVQARDNDYYLHRMFDRTSNAAGTLFMDYRNLPNLEDPNTLVYGHHMRNGSMFGELVKYEEQAYYEAHPYLLIVSGEETDVVEAFAGYTTSPKDHCYDIAISDEEDMAEFIETALEKSDFLHEIERQPGERLITLSTCSYRFENARYILIGRLINVWKKEARTE